MSKTVGISFVHMAAIIFLVGQDTICSVTWPLRGPEQLFRDFRPARYELLPGLVPLKKLQTC